MALELLGDSWSLLVVRDLMFKGLRTFGEFLDAGEGIASNILTDRLGRLERCGIISSRPDETDGRRLVYKLTEKGIALAPVLLELVVWSADHEVTDAPPETVEAMRNKRRAFLRAVRANWERA